MVQVIWTEPALGDLRDIVQHISQDSPVYAERFANAVVEAPRRLARFPRSDSAGKTDRRFDRMIPFGNS